MKLETKAKKIGATIPTQDSKFYDVLSCFHGKHKLTVSSCLVLCHTTELRTYVSRLRAAPYRWPIKSKWVNTSDGRHKEYYL